MVKFTQAWIHLSLFCPHTQNDQPSDPNHNIVVFFIAQSQSSTKSAYFPWTVSSFFDVEKLQS